MRRIALIVLGIFGLWLGGCVAESQAPTTTETTDETSETTAGDTTSGGTLSGDPRLRADLSKVGSSQQNLRLHERPPPQPYIQAEPLPPSPGEGK
jgi:hypothetical protein